MIARFLTSLVRLFTGAHARWAGCPPIHETPRVYFANHTSHLDFVLLWSSLPHSLRVKTRPAAAADYWGAGKFRSWLAKGVFNAVLIERVHVTKANHPVTQLLEAMKGGDSIIIFPEGTRNPNSSGEMSEFKSGLYHLARERPDAEFVPVYLENLSRVLPKGELLPVPILCAVTFGAPVKLADGELKEEFLKRARAAVAHLHTP